jgi:phage tail protein X
MNKTLRLSDELVSEFVEGCISNNNGLKAAAELRRLHEVNQMLVEALEITVPYLPAKTATLSEVEDAIAKAKEQA